jgi:hypothetical protein
LQLPLLAQSVPKKLKKGMNWSVARNLILEKGWQPVARNTSLGEAIANPSPYQTILIQLYPEMSSCTSMGVEVCQFKFVNRKGKSLQVLTLYTPGFLEPLVDQWTTK